MKNFDFSMNVYKDRFSDKCRKFFVLSGNCEKLFSFGKFDFLEKEIFPSSMIVCVCVCVCVCLRVCVCE